MRTILFILAALVIVSGGQKAQSESALRSLVTGNDSRGWSGVGRLNIGSSAFCTGALIAEDLVLTAAHCLYDPATGKQIDAGDIEFLADWRNGRASAYRGVRRAIPHPGFDYRGADTADRVANDLALLQLDQPVRKSTVSPFGTDARPRKGAEVGVVSYAHDRAESPSLQEVCHVLARQGGMLVLSCDIDFGSSGAPVFTVENGVAKVVSVISAKAEAGGRKVALGTDLQRPLADLMALMAQGDGVFSRPEPVARRLTLDEGRAQAGAKFLRP